MAKLPETKQTLNFTITAQDQGTRLDHYLTQKLSLSRHRIQKVIDLGHVTVNDKHEKKGYPLEKDDQIIVTLVESPTLEIVPTEIVFDVIYEDNDIAVINKPANLTVHPIPGQDILSLAHGLLYRFKSLSNLGGEFRPGLVHRLDRYTSGVMVIAKTNEAHQHLSEQFSQHLINKQYSAIVHGVVEFDQNEVNQPITRQPKHREKMITSPEGKVSLTRIDVVKRFRRHTWVNCFPKTGRRHQIRVHCHHLGHVILGDSLYGSLLPIHINNIDPNDTENSTIILNRLALHAHKIEFTHPTTQKKHSHIAPICEDIQTVLNHLNASS